MTWSLWLLQERKWSSRRPWPKATRRESKALQVPGIWALVVILIFVTYFARWGNLPYFDPEEHEIESGLLAMIPKQGSQSKNHLWFQPKRVPPSTNSLYSPLQSCGSRHIFLLFKHFPGPWGRDKFGKFGKQPSSSFSCVWIFMVQKNYYGFLIPKGFLFCHWVVEKISDFELTGAWPANKKPPRVMSPLFPSNWKPPSWRLQRLIEYLREVMHAVLLCWILMQFMNYTERNVGWLDESYPYL